MPLPADIELRVGRSATLDEGALEISLVQPLEQGVATIHVSSSGKPASTIGGRYATTGVTPVQA
jgi:hypothetical protein